MKSDINDKTDQLFVFVCLNSFTALPQVLLVIKIAYHMPIPQVPLMMNTS